MYNTCMQKSGRWHFPPESRTVCAHELHCLLSHMNLQLLSLNCVTPNRTTKSTEHVKQVQKLQIDTDRGFQNKPEKIGTVCDHLRLGTIIPVLTISSQLKPDAQEVIATRGVCVFSCGKFSCSGRRWVDDGWVAVRVGIFPHGILGQRSCVGDHWRMHIS